MNGERKSTGAFVNRGKYAGEAPRQVDQPEPGFFKLRLARGGPWVPARIWYGPPIDPITGEDLDRSPRLQAQTFDFEPTADFVRICKVWTHGVRIDEAEYDFMRASIAYAKAHRPSDPIANPFRTVDVASLPPVTSE